MAKYELLEKAFINNRIYEVGEVVDVDNSAIPGPFMKPIDARRKSGPRKWAWFLAPCPTR